MEEKKKDSVTIEKSTLWMISTFALLIIFVGFLIFNYAGGSNDVDPDTQQPTTGNIRVTIEDDDAMLGDPDAEITVVEFSDFQCPFCERAFSGLVTDLKNSDYVSNGEVNLVYKHFPLRSIHPQAQLAAEASVCAQKQEKFWEYHDALFQNQQALDVNSLKSYASQIGLNTNQFNTCLDNGEGKSQVDADYAQAPAAGAQGTPYFVVINTKTGEKQVVSGAVPFANLEAAIQAVQ